MTSRYFESTFAFDDAAETEQHLADAYGSARIERDFEFFSQELSGDETVQLHTGRFSGAYTAAVEIDQYVVATALGSCGWREGRESGDMSLEPVVFRPGHPYTNHLADTENRAVVFDAGALQRTARLLAGQPELQLAFEGPHPATSRTGGTWLAVLRIARTLQATAALHNDLVRANLFRLLSVTALESFRVRGDFAPRDPSRERARRIYESGIEFFHAHASLPITVDDAAATAAASVPELVQAFRRHHPLEATPTAALQRIRLDNALRDVREAAPAEENGRSIEAIAARWGFSSAHELSRHFRAVYGTDS